MLTTLAISNYRSIRDLVMPLGPLNLVTGANGSGKSNLYRALRLLAETAQGGVVSTLAREGGLASTLWAGPETISRRMRTGEVPVQGGPRTERVALRMGFASDEFGYAIDLGLPIPAQTMFGLDPEVKTECIWNGAILRPSAALVERRGPLVKVRDERGQWQEVTRTLPRFDSMFNQLADPIRTPEVLRLRDQVRSWRFYDHFRTDSEAPARLAQVGTRTPVLAHDGRDLAAALQTIRENGDANKLSEAIEDAFPGATLGINEESGWFSLELKQYGLLRPLRAAELSDGTLRYLLWIAALLTPRPPALMVLNEPETSLHPDLLPALAKLIRVASRNTQIWIICHATRLIAALLEDQNCMHFELQKELGQTRLVDQNTLEQPAWKWPPR
ncbi:MAG: AAA family ATPase [Steroidobacter sp.]